MFKKQKEGFDMNKKLFAIRLKQARKEAGFSTQEDFADEYNRKFPPERRNESATRSGKYGGILGRLKGYESQSKKGGVDLETVLNMAKILGCDLDYLTGRIDEKTHDLQSVCDYTGLSATTIEHFREIKEDCYPFDSHTIDVLFDTSESFEWFCAFKRAGDLCKKLYKELGAYPLKIQEAKQDSFAILELNNLLHGKQEDSLASLRKEWAVAMYDFSRKSTALFSDIEKELEKDMSKKERAIRNAIDSIIEKGAGDDGEGHTQG